MLGLLHEDFTFLESILNVAKTVLRIPLSMLGSESRLQWNQIHNLRINHIKISFCLFSIQSYSSWLLKNRSREISLDQSCHYSHKWQEINMFIFTRLLFWRLNRMNNLLVISSSVIYALKHLYYSLTVFIYSFVCIYSTLLKCAVLS